MCGYCARLVVRKSTDNWLFSSVFFVLKATLFRFGSLCACDRLHPGDIVSGTRFPLRRSGAGPPGAYARGHTSHVHLPRWCDDVMSVWSPLRRALREHTIRERVRIEPVCVDGKILKW